jgi:hypothetical protein
MNNVAQAVSLRRKQVARAKQVALQNKKAQSINSAPYQLLVQSLLHRSGFGR